MNNKLSLAQDQRVDFTSLFAMDGYDVESVIGTTYCLNYETLLMLILAITYGPGADKALEHRCENISPAAIFAAIKNMHGKLKVYCQADKTEELSGTNNNENMQRIKVLLDEFVEPIPMKNVNGAFSSFHSKVWLISFKKKNHKYRMIVTSRNLTSNRDFDAVAVFDNAGNDTSCVKKISEQINPPEEWKNQFKNICFEPEPQEITKDVVNECHSVISPFLDADLLEKEELYGLNIFSLRSEIDKVWKVNRTLLEKHHFYCFNPALERQVEEGVHSSIHAKLYISKDFIILGSSNFTTRGWNLNREFNVKLASGIDKDTLLQEFGVYDETKCGRGMFVPYAPPANTDDIKEDDKDNVFQNLACITLQAGWDEKSETLSLKVICPDGINLPDGIKWRPLMKDEWHGADDLSWQISVENISKIFICKIKSKEIQMLASWENVPENLWETRYNFERSKLSIADELDFRMLMLVNSNELFGRDITLKRNGVSNDLHCPPRPPIFEQLLKADNEQLKKFFKEPIFPRDNDPLGLVQAFNDLKEFFSNEISGGQDK